MAVTKTQVLKTMLLPGLFPRMKEFLGTGFNTFAHLIAIVYNTVRILPDNHPYLKSDMVGKYGIRQVIAEAANHIKPNRKNIDQVIIFFSIIAAFFILIMQFILLFAAMLISQARAQEQPTTIEGFFKTPNPQEDLAYRLLDLVFGVPDFFGSKEKVNTALHQGLHQLLEFYSFGILIVAVIIIVYFVIAVVSETAQSGTPFGQRFNKAWAPIRIILFLAILLPVSNGLNGGQYITLGVAKMGSSLASTGWVLFNDIMADENATLVGKKDLNVATPNAPELSHLPSYMLIAKTCQVAYNDSYNTDFWKPTWDPSGAASGVKAWAVYQNLQEKEQAQSAVPEAEKKVEQAQLALAEAQGEYEGLQEDGASTADIQAAKVKLDAARDSREKAKEDLQEAVEKSENTANYESELAKGKSFQDLTVKSRGTDIHLVFGVKDINAYPNIKAGIKPVCGEVVLPVTDVKEPGTRVIQTAYYTLMNEMWDGSKELSTYATNYARRYLGISPDAEAELPSESYKQEWISALNKKMNGGDGEDGIIKEAVDAQIESGEWQMPQEMKDFGWAGAGIWYNTIAQQNGALVSALHQIPKILLYPHVMEVTRKQNLIENRGLSKNSVYDVKKAAGSPGQVYEMPNDRNVAITLAHTYKFWEGSENKSESKSTGNVLIDSINAILGTQGLFEICKNTDIHPLAQLSAVGKSMLDHSIGAFAASGILSIGSIIPSPLSTSASSFASFFSTVGSVGLLIGFILFYVLPFMPFLYFFFAVGSWIKSIFEAMVAVPLWALAHLRIDGDGIPGEAAINGYFMLFEIFIRPLLIVFGLLASIAIFAAMIKVLNEIFYLAISNMSGHDPKSSQACFQTPSADLSGAGPDQVIQKQRAQTELKEAYRGPVDEFFFTILYTILVYMIGTASFKLIDKIPNEITRWFNGEISAFSDNSGDAAAGLMTYVTLGGRQFGEQIGGSIGNLGNGIKSSVQSFSQRG